MCAGGGGGVPVLPLRLPSSRPSLPVSSLCGACLRGRSSLAGVKAETRDRSAQRGGRLRGWAGPHPHDAHVVHARQPLVALLGAVDLLPQLLRRPDVVPPRRVHPLEGQPAGLRVEMQAGPGHGGQDPGLGWGSRCWGTRGRGGTPGPAGGGRVGDGMLGEGRRPGRLGGDQLGPRAGVKGPGYQRGLDPRDCGTEGPDLWIGPHFEGI